MTTIKIFVVFHQTVDQGLIFPYFTDEEITQWFVMYGVNIDKDNKKIITKQGNQESNLDALPGVTLEYNLPIHDPEIQRQGFMETSCFLHILSNQLASDADLIGVTQYDMRWTKKSSRLLRKINTQSAFDHWQSVIKDRTKKLLNPHYQTPQTVYAQVDGKVINNNGIFNPMASVSTFNWAYLIESYNRYFHTNWLLKDLQGQPLTLWQTYLMPRELFISLAGWLKLFIKEVAPWANQPPYKTHWGVLGGFSERAEALFIALQAKAGKIIVRPLYLEHDENIPKQLDIRKEHYGNPKNSH
jgi:hypothetical protein